MVETQLTEKHWIAVFGLFLAIVCASIQPLEFSSYSLHQLGTVFMLIILFYVQYKVGLTFASFFAYLVFLLIHVLGAHYLYSYVPYNDWIQSLWSFDLNTSMGWTRNMYDRVVHFAYGLLLYPFFYRVFQVWLPQVKRTVLAILVIQFVMASSVFYEWLEWWIAMSLSPESAENYNGQQGDVWDAHQDMFIATLGAMLTGLLLFFRQSKLR